MGKDMIIMEYVNAMKLTINRFIFNLVDFGKDG